MISRSKYQPLSVMWHHHISALATITQLLQVISTNHKEGVNIRNDSTKQVRASLSVPAHPPICTC